MLNRLCVEVYSRAGTGTHSLEARFNRALRLQVTSDECTVIWKPWPALGRPVATPCLLSMWKLPIAFIYTDAPFHSVSEQNKISACNHAIPIPYVTLSPGLSDGAHDFLKDRHASSFMRLEPVPQLYTR